MLCDSWGTAAFFPGKTNLHIYPGTGKIYPHLKYHSWPTELLCSAVSPAINFSVYSYALEPDRSLWMYTLGSIVQMETYFNKLTLHTPRFSFIFLSERGA